MKIALDALGGDNAPISNIEGAFSYLDHFGQSAADLILVGDKNKIESTIQKLSRNISEVTSDKRRSL